jgi:hypothetical protein
MITPKVTLDRYPLSLCTPCSDWQYPCPRHARICPRGSLPRSSQRHRNVRARGGAGSEICINSCRPRRTTCTVQQGGEHKRPFGQPGLGSSCARQASPPLADARARCLVLSARHGCRHRKRRRHHTKPSPRYCQQQQYLNL